MGAPRDRSAARAIENLIATYAELVDDGDFAAVGVLLADAEFTGGAGSLSGADAIEGMLRDNLIVYDDGTPRPSTSRPTWRSRLTTRRARRCSRSYFTVLQALPDMALQPIVAGRYHDRFERHDGRWRFVERRVRTDLVGARAVTCAGGERGHDRVREQLLNRRNPEP